MFFNSFKMLYFGWTTSLSIINLSGNGGIIRSWIVSYGGWVCTETFGMFTSSKIASFMGSLESSSSLFGSWMMTDDLGLLFTTLPDRNWISCIGVTYLLSLNGFTCEKGVKFCFDFTTKWVNHVSGIFYMEFQWIMFNQIR